MAIAYEKMKRMNQNALIGYENGLMCMIEDVSDADGRMYRIEIQSTEDGNHAIGWCRYNPWGENTHEYIKSHLRNDGFLCLSSQSDDDIYKSPINVEDAIKRARYWCTGYSYLREHGVFPDL